MGSTKSIMTTAGDVEFFEEGRLNDSSAFGLDSGEKWGHAGNLEISSRVELKSGRLQHVAADKSSTRKSFDGALSRQSVRERSTQSGRDDKVQEQVWRQALEQKLRAPLARPHDDIISCK